MKAPRRLRNPSSLRLHGLGTRARARTSSDASTLGHWLPISPALFLFSFLVSFFVTHASCLQLSPPQHRRNCTPPSFRRSHASWTRQLDSTAATPRHYHGVLHSFTTATVSQPNHFFCQFFGNDAPLSHTTTPKIPNLRRSFFLNRLVQLEIKLSRLSFFACPWIGTVGIHIQHTRHRHTWIDTPLTA